MVLGRAESAQEVIQNAKVLLAPIPFGAGAKGKLLEAMCYGTPSVTSTIGAESMFGDLPWNGIIADDIEGITEAAITLYQDQSLWETAQQNGNAIVNQRNLKSLFESDFMERILEVLTNLEAHRNTNFTGSMLMHHTMASTQYMSRWIEAKNKK